MAECEPGNARHRDRVDSTDPIGPAEGLFNAAFYDSCLQALRAGGILVQQSESPARAPAAAQDHPQRDEAAGFHALRTLTVPATLLSHRLVELHARAQRRATCPMFRERGAATKQFATRYYNADMHKAALAMPEFLKEALGE